MGRYALAGAIALGALTSAQAVWSQDESPPSPPPGRFVTPELGDGPWEFATEAAGVRVSVVTKGLDHPWAIAFVPGGDMLVTERPGRLRVIRDGMLDPVPIAGLPPIEPGLIGGLLDLALHPQFAQNRLIYFSYSTPDPDDPAMSTTAVARARWNGGSTLSDVENVFVADAWHGSPVTQRVERCCGQGPAGGSFGSRIAFDAAGFLFITIGDRNYGEQVQDPSNHFGKIVRIRDDGSIPEDNPFFGRRRHHDDIWSTGHRNPLGLTFHPVTGALWESEFGPRGGDEVNIIEPGNNYGWMLVTHGEHYNDDPVELGNSNVEGFVDPVLHWEPSINPGNLLFPMTDEFPNWRGDMLMATMSRSLLRASFDDQGRPGGQELMLTELGQRLRDVRQGPDGKLYVLTDETAGAVLMLESTQPQRLARSPGGFGPAAAEVVSLNENVHMIRYGAAGNVTALVNGSAVALIDTDFEMSFDVIAEQLRTITSEPVDYVINTHLHGDHIGGNSRWQALDAKVIASEKARRLMQTANAPGLANITFEDGHMRIWLEDMPVDLYYFGRGHTDGDVVVHLPDAGIVFTGDLMPFWGNFDQVIDYANGGSAREWPRTLQKVLALDFDVVVPGHGAATDRATLEQYLAYTQRTRDTIREMNRQRRSREEIRAVLINEFGWSGLSVGVALDGLIGELR